MYVKPNESARRELPFLVPQETILLVTGVSARIVVGNASSSNHVSAAGVMSSIGSVMLKALDVLLIVAGCCSTEKASEGSSASTPETT